MGVLCKRAPSRCALSLFTQTPCLHAAGWRGLGQRGGPRPAGLGLRARRAGGPRRRRRQRWVRKQVSLGTYVLHRLLLPTFSHHTATHCPAGADQGWGGGGGRGGGGGGGARCAGRQLSCRAPKQWHPNITTSYFHACPHFITPSKSPAAPPALYSPRRQPGGTTNWREVVSNDLQAEKPIWVLSCYASTREGQNDLPGDISPEEASGWAGQARRARAMAGREGRAGLC